MTPKNVNDELSKRGGGEKLESLTVDYNPVFIKTFYISYIIHNVFIREKFLEKFIP